MSVTGESSIRITLVGDYVGKTNLISSYLYNKYPEFDIELCTCHKTIINVDNEEYQVEIQDTPAQEEWERMRALLYPNTSCILMCYSISQRASYKNIVGKWMPEVRRYYMRHTPIILVATKADYRSKRYEEIITELEGKTLQKKIKAEHYIECSAEERKNLKLLFDQAVRCSIRHNKRTDSKSCILM